MKSGVLTLHSLFIIISFCISLYYYYRMKSEECVKFGRKKKFSCTELTVLKFF